MFLPVTQPNVIVLVLPQHCSFTYEQCCNTARLHTSSVFPSKLKLNTDPEAEPYGIHVQCGLRDEAGHFAKRMGSQPGVLGHRGDPSGQSKVALQMLSISRSDPQDYRSY